MNSHTLSIAVLFVALSTVATSAQDTISIEDLSGKHGDNQIVVDREKGQYLGHPTTCLLEDGKTILCVYPKGHGKGAIIYKRSSDGGKTWSRRLKTPESWATSKETPTLHRVIGPDGKKRIIMFSGLYPARMAVTEDDGENWSELKKVGDWGGIVVMGSVFPLESGAGTTWRRSMMLAAFSKQVKNEKAQSNSRCTKRFPRTAD